MEIDPARPPWRNCGNLCGRSPFYLSMNPRPLQPEAVALPEPFGLRVAAGPARPWWEGSQVGPVKRLECDVDADTLERARSGDRQAQEAFVRCYERRVHAFLGRSLVGRAHVDDLAQEVFLRVLRALPRFESKGARVSTWIFSIAVRLLADERRGRRRWFLPFDEARASASGRTPEEGAMDREALTELERALLELSTEQRMALALFEIHQLSHEEVAEAMGTSVATVKTRLFRARRALRACLRDRGPGTKGERR